MQPEKFAMRYVITPYNEGGQVAKPEITLDENSSENLLSITSATSGAKIYYTLLDSDKPSMDYINVPTENSTEYTTPVSMEGGKKFIVRAVAKKDGMADSPVSTAVIEPKLPVTLHFYENAKSDKSFDLPIRSGTEFTAPDYPDTFSVPEGKVFDYWMTQYGGTFKPGEKVNLVHNESEMNVYANYVFPAPVIPESCTFSESKTVEISVPDGYYNQEGLRLEILYSTETNDYYRAKKYEEPLTITEDTTVYAWISFLEDNRWEYSKAAEAVYKKEVPGGNTSGDDPSGDNPSGDDPSGDNPSGDDPSGDNPSGDDPSGDNPSGDDPSGDNPAEGGSAVINDTNTPLAETATGAAMNFSDVKDTDWFYEAVKTVFEKGLITGTSDTAFSPNLAVT